MINLRTKIIKAQLLIMELLKKLYPQSEFSIYESLINQGISIYELTAIQRMIEDKYNIEFNNLHLTIYTLSCSLARECKISRTCPNCGSYSLYELPENQHEDDHEHLYLTCEDCNEIIKI